MIMNLVARFLGSNARDGTEELPGDGDPQEQARAIASLVEPVEALGVELGRARRYEHALSIVVVSPRPIGSERPERSALLGRLGAKPPLALSYLAAAGLREILRTSDIVSWDPDEHRFVLALAESDRATAQGAMRRVRTVFAERLGLELDAGVAQFPVDGLTLADLVAKAGEELHVEGAGRRDGPEPEPEREGRPADDGSRPARRRSGTNGRGEHRQPPAPGRRSRGAAAAIDARVGGGGE